MRVTVRLTGSFSRTSRALGLAAAWLSLPALSLPALSLPALVMAGCAGRDTRVERGELVKTGEGEFDAFFSELHALGKRAKEAEQKEREARGELAEALGLDASADADASIEAAEDKARAHKEEGLLLHLRLTPEPKVVTAREGARGRRGRKRPPAASEPLVSALELATKREIDLARELDDMASRAASLESKRRSLAKKTQAIKGKRPTEKRAIQHELEAAEEVLREAEDRSRRMAGFASKFVLDLARAVETGAADAAPPPSAPPPPAAVAKKRGPGKRSGKPAGKPAGGATKPASASAKPSGADFDR